MDNNSLVFLVILTLTYFFFFFFFALPVMVWGVYRVWKIYYVPVAFPVPAHPAVRIHHEVLGDASSEIKELKRKVADMSSNLADMKKKNSKKAEANNNKKASTVFFFFVYYKYNLNG